ncbi:MAG: glycosyltransferase family 4 protein [Candidatus Lokiarchaeota archaeon]|nr:glycosyltransferase family 4 protein [Candidatus Lokiarchaeota archaeon]
MEKLNICLVSLTIAPDSQDGAGIAFRGMFDYLRKQGHNVKLITGKWNIDLNDPDIIQFNLIQKRFLWAPQFIFKAIKYINSHDFDIFHGNAPKGTLPIILSNRKKFITTIHDLGPFETSFTKIPLEKYLIKLAVHKASLITTDSEFIKREIKYFIPKVDINKIYNHYLSIDEKFMPYPQEAEKLRENMKIDGPVILYIGRIAFYKGVDDIIAAYYIAKKEIPDLNLVIGGTPDFQMAKKYEDWKIKYTDIHFVGYVEDQKLPHYYSMGDVFVTYSFASEGFGLTPIEAIACGTPVICSSMIAYKEILQDNAIFVPPRRPQQLAQKIVNVLKDEVRTKDMLEKAREFIKRYSWDSVGEKLEKFYFKFINQ